MTKACVAVDRTLHHLYQDLKAVVVEDLLMLAMTIMMAIMTMAMMMTTTMMTVIVMARA